MSSACEARLENGFLKGLARGFLNKNMKGRNITGVLTLFGLRRTQEGMQCSRRTNPFSRVARKHDCGGHRPESGE